MPKHKTTSKNSFENADANNVIVNKCTVLGVDANTIYCTLCHKPAPIIRCGMEQVNQYVRGKNHKSFSVTKVSSSQSLLKYFKCSTCQTSPYSGDTSRRIVVF